MSMTPIAAKSTGPASPAISRPGKRIADVRFTVPGTVDQQAVTRAFGVVFSDIDLASTTGIEFFDLHGISLGHYYAPVADNGLSFLGVLFDSAVVGSARIVTGNAALGPHDGSGTDVVAMDDFIYAEPIAAAVPEPAGLTLLAVAGAALLARTRRV